MAKTKTKKKKAAAQVSDAPRIIAAKGGLTQSALLVEALARMEDDLRVTKKQGKDFIESLLAAVDEEISKGRPVNLFGMVKLVPRYHTAGSREVLKEFGVADSGKMTKKYKPKVTLKATLFKRVKDQLPGATKMQKVVGQ
ncbi:MAG: hypothetical protein ABIQ41_09050 [Gemmatimonadales bacterium]